MTITRATWPPRGPFRGPSWFDCQQSLLAANAFHTPFLSSTLHPDVLHSDLRQRTVVAGVTDATSAEQNATLGWHRTLRRGLRGLVLESVALVLEFGGLLAERR